MLITAFRGWNDGGQAATVAAGYLVEQWDAMRFADVDPEAFMDFQAVRPTVTLDEGLTRRIEWPENAFYHAAIPGTDRDAVILVGVEPNYRWRAFSDLVIGLARDVGVDLVVTLGALLADVPHTRPTSVTGFASDDSLISHLGFQRSSYEGPTGVVGALHHACQQHGMPSASLWASVPHYVAAAPNPKAALALIRGFEGLVGLAVDAAPLEEAAAEYERQVNDAVASDPDVKAFVEQLEERMDDVQDDALPDRLPSADSIARDFQRYLKQRGPESS